MDSSLKNGYITEQQFIVDAMQRDLTVSKPVSNVEPYDFIVEGDSGVFRIQVKKAYLDNHGRWVVCLRSSQRRNGRSYLADSDRVDYLAVCVDGGWYIMPHNVIKHIRSNLALSDTGKYKNYIENWDFV